MTNSSKKDDAPGMFFFVRCLFFVCLLLQAGLRTPRQTATLLARSLVGLRMCRNAKTSLRPGLRSTSPSNDLNFLEGHLRS